MTNILIKFFSKNRTGSKVIISEDRTESKDLIFKDISNNPFRLLITRVSDCYGYIDGVNVCTFETMHIEGNLLHINHFALVTDLIGTNFGETCLRAFAALVETQQPSINCISFSLHRSTSETKKSEQILLKLANARIRLLENLGAINIELKKPNNECYDVTGKWYKNRWKLSEV